MTPPRRLRLLRLATALVSLGGLATGAGCAEKHEFDRRASPDGGFVLTVDYITRGFTGQHDAVVSLQERRGLATEVAAFGKVQTLAVSWIGPQDIGICQVGDAKLYKRDVDVNAHDGVHSFHVHYGCS